MCSDTTKDRKKREFNQSCHVSSGTDVIRLQSAERKMITSQENRWETLRDDFQEAVDETDSVHQVHDHLDLKHVYDLQNRIPADPESGVDVAKCPMEWFQP